MIDSVALVGLPFFHPGTLVIPNNSSVWHFVCILYLVTTSCGDHGLRNSIVAKTSSWITFPLVGRIRNNCTWNIISDHTSILINHDCFLQAIAMHVNTMFTDNQFVNRAIHPNSTVLIYIDKVNVLRYDWELHVISSRVRSEGRIKLATTLVWVKVSKCDII